MSVFTLKLLSAQRAAEALAASDPKATLAGVATTMDFKPIDQARNAAQAALAPAYQSGRLPVGVWSGIVQHPEPHEKHKKYFPAEKQVAWEESVVIKGVGFDALNEKGELTGRLWLLAHPSQGSAERERFSFWLAGPEGAMSYYRFAQRELSHAPDAMGMLVAVASPGFIDAQLAVLEKEQLDAVAAPGASSGPARATP